MWIMLFIYFCPFINFAKHGIISLWLLITLMIGIIIFLYGAGLYFSSRFKNTNSAILAFLVFMAAIWFVVPMVFRFVVPIVFRFGLPRHYRGLAIFIEFLMKYGLIVNPFILVQTVMTSDLHPMRYNFRLAGQYRDSIQLMVIIVLTYAAAGIIFAWRAKRWFRRNIS
jgi:hypothetical protein